MIDITTARSTTRWGGVAGEHTSIAEFERCASLSDGLHTIHGGPVPIDVLLRLKRGRPLVFSFHGNTPRNPELKLPVFTGLNVTRDLDASFVAISDPMLYLDPDLKLAWYAGSAGWNFQAEMKRVLRKIIAVALTADVVFFGGSGGGFASLYYAAAFPGSLALVWNPQTDIGAYNPPHVTEYGRVAFGLPDHASTTSALPTLTESNLARVYDGSVSNYLVYLQNNTDGHVITHMRPFLTSLGADVQAMERGADLNGAIVPGVWLYMANWGDGHVPPTPAALARLLTGVISAAGHWPALMASDEFARLLEDSIASPATAPTSHGATPTLATANGRT
jgi:pimeloyl-ACP methyl ester carboxylesterase